MDVELWTDGACSGNPGPGGWAVLLRARGHEREISGAEAETTNNRMELMAVVAGLRALTRPCRVQIHLDSSYVMNAFTQNWLTNWQRNNWLTAAKTPVKNRDLWEELLEETGRHQIQWVKVKGHAGHAENERVDALAVCARENIARS